MNVDTAAHNSLRLLPCVVGEDQYGLNVAGVKAIHRLADVTPDLKDPRLSWLCPSTIRERVPVVSLARLLQGKGVSRAQAGRVLLLHGSESPWALHVDGFANVVDVESDETYSLSLTGFRGPSALFSGVVRASGGFLPYLSLPNLAAAFAELTAERYATFSGEIPLAEDERRRVDTETRDLSGLRERRQRSAKSRVREQLVTFSSGGSDSTRALFGLSLSQVFELIQWQTPQPLPGLPDYFLGLLELRGRPVPVMDLSARLGLSAPIVEAERMLVARTAFKQLVAIPVGSETRLVQLPIPHGAHDGKLEFDASLSRGVFQLGARRLIVPDLERLLSPPDAF